MSKEPQATTSPLMQSTGKAIVLTFLTTMIGCGSLMVARHSGIFSLGLLSTLAVGCRLVASLVALPLLLHLLPSGQLPASPQPHGLSTALPEMDSSWPR